MMVGVFLAFSTIYWVRFQEGGASSAVCLSGRYSNVSILPLLSILESNFWEVKSVFRLLGARLCVLK